MREILFRGKRSDNNEWAEGFFLTSPEFDNIGLSVITEINPRCPRYVFKNTVGQYTGLTDKHGNKIFEGDVVQYADEDCCYSEEQCEFIGKIVCVHGAFGIATDDNIPIDLDFWCDNDNFISLWELYWNLCVDGEMMGMVEVIGNIHDNPELLGGGEE